MPKENEEQKTPTPKNRMVKPEMTRVRATRAIYEGGSRYEKGESFEVDKSRAEAISHHVESAEEPAAE